MSGVLILVGRLVGRALDYAVAIAEGQPAYIVSVAAQIEKLDREQFTAFEIDRLRQTFKAKVRLSEYVPCPRYSDDSAVGAPLLHKHAVWLKPSDPYAEFGGTWTATCITSRERAAHTYYHEEGDTPLIAGMRAIVGAILGDTVEIPTELLEQSA